MLSKSIKLVFLILLSGWFSERISAQSQPPNNGFENWENSGLGEDPTDWGSRNQHSPMGYPVLVSKTSTANSGNYALKLVSDTATIPAPFPDQGYDTLPAILLLNGTFPMGPPSSGIPFTFRPDSMKGFVIAAPANGDLCHIHAKLIKNSLLYGEAIYVTKVPITGYKEFSVPFNYFSFFDPDSLTIEIAAGDPHGSAKAGTEFLVDDLSFIYNSVKIADFSENNKIKIFPNPTDEFIYLRMPGMTNISKISIYNYLGVEMADCIFFKSVDYTMIDLSSLGTGIYLLKICKEGQLYNSRIYIQ